MQPRGEDEAQVAQLRAQVELRSQEESRGVAGPSWGLFAIVLLILALGLAVWGLYSRGAGEENNPVGTSGQSANPALPVAVSSAPQPVANPGGSTVASTSASPATQPAVLASSEPASTAPTPRATKAVNAPAPTGTPSVEPASSQKPKASPLLLRIKARQDCWISITVDGEVVTQEILIAPDQKSVRASKEIVIRAGNVGALDFEFNGQKLPPQGDYAEAKTLTFDANGLQSPPPNVQPSATPTAQPPP